MTQSGHRIEIPQRSGLLPRCAVESFRSDAPETAVLIGLAENDPEAQDRISAFTHRLQQIGWTDRDA
jgi:hypothetical protein